MDYAALLQLILSGAGLVGGELAAAPHDQAARDAQKKALAELLNLNAPTLSAIRPEALGTPESSIQDPELKAAQMAALARLQKVSDEGGNTLEDQATFNKYQNQAAQRDAAARGALLENMQARGVAGSGAELAAKLAGQQATAQNAALAGEDQAAQAQKRALQAIMQRGQLADTLSSADMRRKEAKDAVARYNAQARERGQQYTRQGEQQDFENRNKVAQLHAGGYGQAAAGENVQGQNLRRAFNAAGTGLGSALKSSVPKTNPYSYEDDEEVIPAEMM